MSQTNLEGDPILGNTPLWMIDGDDCRYWKKKWGSKEYKRRKKKYSQQYNRKHKKEIAKRSKKYYQEYREEKLESNRKYYHKHRCNPEYMEKRRISNQKYYRKHKGKDRKRRQKHYKEVLEWIWSIKKSICLCCGDQERRLMHFHHIYPPRLFAITRGMKKRRDIIQIELNKCVVLCSNCHTMLHKALGTGIIKPLSEIISVLSNQFYHPEMRWLIFLLYPEVYPQTNEDWHEVWGNSE